MSESKRTKQFIEKKTIKLKLSSLLKELGNCKGTFFNSDGVRTTLSTDSEITYHFPNIAYGIGEFIKQCLISEKDKDYELIGLAQTVIEKAKEIIEKNHQAWEEYEESRRQEAEEARQKYYENKPYYNATDIGKLLEFSDRGVETNKLLESLGYQTRQSSGWVVTSKADGLCEQCGLEEGRKPYIRWEKAIIEHIKNELEANKS